MVVPAFEVLKNEAAICTDSGIRLDPLDKEEAVIPKTVRHQYSTTQEYVWDRCYVKHLCKHRLCPFMHIGCRSVSASPLGKSLLPVSFHSEEIITHPDLAMKTVIFEAEEAKRADRPNDSKLKSNIDFLLA